MNNLDLLRVVEVKAGEIYDNEIRNYDMKVLEIYNEKQQLIGTSYVPIEDWVSKRAAYINHKLTILCI